MWLVLGFSAVFCWRFRRCESSNAEAIMLAVQVRVMLLRVFWWDICGAIPLIKVSANQNWRLLSTLAQHLKAANFLQSFRLLIIRFFLRSDVSWWVYCQSLAENSACFSFCVDGIMWIFIQGLAEVRLILRRFENNLGSVELVSFTFALQGYLSKAVLEVTVQCVQATWRRLDLLES